MIIPKKKVALKELAISAFLLLEFNEDTTALSVVRRIRERAVEALKAASFYTGIIGEQHVQDFLKLPPLSFTIDCGSDIVKGDTIRFIESAYNNCVKPSRYLGKRGVTAEVLDVDKDGDDGPELHMRVIASGGTWDLKPNTEITRPLRIVTRFEVMRVPWERESERSKPPDNDTYV